MTPLARGNQALIVHPDLGGISGLQDALARNGYEVISARDLPTALLAATSHFFDVLVISSRVTEEGDGWPLAGVMHLIFPRAHIAVIARDKNVSTIQAAINHGATGVFEAKTPPADVVGAILKKVPPSSKRIQ